MGQRYGGSSWELEDELNTQCEKTVVNVTLDDHDGLNDIKMKIAKAHKMTTADPKKLLLSGTAREIRLSHGEPGEITAEQIRSKDGRASIGCVAISDEDCSRFSGYKHI